MDSHKVSSNAHNKKHKRERDFRVEYRRRVALGKQRGYSRAQASGHPNLKIGESGISSKNKTAFPQDTSQPEPKKSQEQQQKPRTNVITMDEERIKGLTQRTLSLLPIPQRDLPEALGISHPYVTLLLKHMEEQDLIKRTSQETIRGRPILLIQRKNNHQSAKMLVATSPCLACICTGAETCPKLDAWLLKA